MSSVDWSHVDWWSLPGPSRFLDDAAELALSEPSGIVGLSLPTRRPRRMLPTLARRLEEEGVRSIPVDAAALDGSLSPAHALAAAAGAQPGTIRSTADFVSAADLADALFIVDGIPMDRWSTWSLFLRAFRSERARSGSLSAPRLAVVQPGTLPPAEIESTLGRAQACWRGVVSRTDMQLYVESLLGPGDDLVHRTRVATITETACWDPDLAELLAGQATADQLNPQRLLASSGLTGLGNPHWGNGLVDLWDGDPHVHTLALLQPGCEEQLTRRIWRAHVGAIFPAVEQVRQTFVGGYHDALASQMPFDKQFNQVVRTYSHPMELEINDVAYLLKPILPADQNSLLWVFKKLRTAMAHMEPADPALIARACTAWKRLVGAIDYPIDAPGWNWPRCGQRLVLLVGPSGAGKTTHATQTYLEEEVISSDRVREELFGTSDMGGSQQRVFETLRARARARLAAGRSAVIDATNLQCGDRLANALVAPRDIAVEYVLIDRPQAEKIRDAGWRAGKPGLIDGHARTFARELPEILAGDGLPNVTVRDLRTSA